MKSTRFNFGRAAIILSALFIFAVTFTACNPNPPAVPSIIGNWVAEYEVFNVTSTTFDTGTGAWSYAGDNLVIEPLSDTSGYLYFKYTKAMCNTHSDTSNYLYVYDTDSQDVGKWYAVSYKNLTDDSVSISGAFLAKEAGGVSSTATLEEAKSTFTVANGYYALYSECKRK